jgi:hypothetical protein
VTHEPRLADGDYVVEIEILTRSDSVDVDGGDAASPASTRDRGHGAPRSNILERRVTFEGNTTSLDISGSIDR